MTASVLIYQYIFTLKNEKNINLHIIHRYYWPCVFFFFVRSVSFHIYDVLRDETF